VENFDFTSTTILDPYDIIEIVVQGDDHIRHSDIEDIVTKALRQQVHKER